MSCSHFHRRLQRNKSSACECTDMTEELAEALSTPHMEVVHHTEHKVNVR